PQRDATAGIAQRCTVLATDANRKPGARGAVRPVAGGAGGAGPRRSRDPDSALRPGLRREHHCRPAGDRRHGGPHPALPRQPTISRAADGTPGFRPSPEMTRWSTIMTPTTSTDDLRNEPVDDLDRLLS